MPSRRNHAPKYRHYRPKDLAVVRIDGHDHDLGKYGSPESWERYYRLLAERASSPVPIPIGANRDAIVAQMREITVAEVVLAYWDHAQAYYRRPDGSTTGELENIRLSLRPLRRLYDGAPASSFGPLALKAVRQSMIDSGLSRATINHRVGKVVRVFRWAVENELVPLRRITPSRRSRGCGRGGRWPPIRTLSVRSTKPKWTPSGPMSPAKSVPWSSYNV